jgi:two-component system sensor histidine kinase DctS
MNQAIKPCEAKPIELTHFEMNSTLIEARHANEHPNTSDFPESTEHNCKQNCEHKSQSYQLHNARNLITHLAVEVEEIVQRHSDVSIQPLQQIASLLKGSSRQDNDNQSLGRHLENILVALDAEQSKISESLQSLSTAVQDLMGIFTQTSGSASLDSNIEPFFVEELIHHVLKQSEKRLAEQQIHISVASHSQSVVHSNWMLLQQVISNLIANSEHALRGNQGKLKQITIEWNTTAGWTKLSIQDNGCGIKKSARTKILDLGYTTKDNGQGLGLNFCQETLQRLHGYLEIDSGGIGCGTKVTLHLPSK